MHKSIKYIVLLKVLVVLGLAGHFYKSILAEETPAQEVSKEEGKSAEKGADENADTIKVPELPKGNLALSDAVKIREQLEFLRQDVLAKIAKLTAAKQGYDKSKKDIEAKLKKIEEERKLLDETLQKEKKSKEERLTEALEFVSKMEPKKAAPVLAAMDRDLVLQLLRKLPQRQVTKILEVIEPKKAAEYLEYYTKIRSGREYELMKELGLCLVENPAQSEQSLNPSSSAATASTKPSTSASTAAAPAGEMAKAPAPVGDAKASGEAEAKAAATAVR